ncbi:C40 family peptidase [Nonomuraea sp. NPDC003707]
MLASPAHASAKIDDLTTLTGGQIKEIQAKQAPKPAWKVAIKFAMSKRGTPYVWGGASPSGYDCSGLMLRAYEHAGIELPRTAAEQYGAFTKKIAWKDLKPGDLVFFHGLGHVGMISRPGYMVHSPHTGDVVKEERLTSWRRDSFVGGVRPDRKGVRLWSKLQKQRDETPTTLTATL